MPWCIPGASLAIVLAVIAPGLSSDRVSRPEALELPSEGGTTLSNGEKEYARDGSVVRKIFQYIRYSTVYTAVHSCCEVLPHTKKMQTNISRTMLTEKARFGQTRKVRTNHKSAGVRRLREDVGYAIHDSMNIPARGGEGERSLPE